MEKSSGQSARSIKENIAFFSNQFNSYNDKVKNLDTYITIRKYINDAVKDIPYLLDIGNGGVFDYDVNLVPKIVGMDLFLDHPPSSLECPDNVILKKGDALAIPEDNHSFDGVLMVMLIHHLIGKTVSECIKNVNKTIDEAYRVLRPGGKLIIVESCVRPWFYQFEKLVFPLVARIIDKIVKHPATLQYPVAFIQDILASRFKKINILKIPLGRWVMIYGIKVPSILTPVMPTIFIAEKN